MRNAFFRALTDIARQDPRVMFMTGDLGFMAAEPYRDALPAQWHNAGVSETNMVGMAAGMALAGHRVFVYSIIPFVTLRVLEFLRNDVCFNRLPVTIVGVGAGYAYSLQAFTHHATEDIAVMRALPGMTVIAPADAIEVDLATRALATYDRPAYLRLGKVGEPRLHQSPPHFVIGRALSMREGRDVTIAACGVVVGLALEAASELAVAGIECRVLSVPTIKPLDRETFYRAAAETRAIVTVEEHSQIGGLGSAVADLLTELPAHPPLRRVGFRDELVDYAGSRAHLLARNGITVESIVAAAREAVPEQQCR